MSKCHVGVSLNPPPLTPEGMREWKDSSKNHAFRSTVLFYKCVKQSGSKFDVLPLHPLDLTMTADDVIIVMHSYLTASTGFSAEKEATHIPESEEQAEIAKEDHFDPLIQQQVCITDLLAEINPKIDEECMKEPFVSVNEPLYVVFTLQNNSQTIDFYCCTGSNAGMLKGFATEKLLRVQQYLGNLSSEDLMKVHCGNGVADATDIFKWDLPEMDENDLAAYELLANNHFLRLLYVNKDYERVVRSALVKDEAQQKEAEEPVADEAEKVEYNFEDSVSQVFDILLQLKNEFLYDLEKDILTSIPALEEDVSIQTE
ncbi:hypothetical protein PCE1_003408 [Barthelona sp. PCE]